MEILNIPTFKTHTHTKDGGMALATMPEELSSTTGPHRVEGENHLSYKSSSALHTTAMACTQIKNKHTTPITEENT